MSIAWALDAILATMVLGVAAWIVATRETFAAVAGFFLFEALGVSGTAALACSLAVVVGAGAWALDRPDFEGEL